MPVGHYVPHTDDEIEQMLAFMGLDSLEALFETIPAALRLVAGEDGRYLDLPDGLAEADVLSEMGRLAAANSGSNTDLVCFAGAGAYDHQVPSAVRSLMFRSEFVTAYTPYQPEVAQGVLQMLFEYQTLISRLTGVGIANASLYDGATACVEAVNLAVAASRKQGVLVSRGVHPNWRDTMTTFAKGTGHDLIDVPLGDDGTTAWPGAGDAEVGAVLVQYPNYLGCIEDLAGARACADAHGALLLVAGDPVSAGLLKTPGSFGADVVVGEAQPFGTPLSFGGPYLGYFACREEHVRRLPGRLVGETVDVDGRRAYVTTLRTREQDIRREKASSNVCTNQTLIAVGCTIALSWLGTTGLRELALRCARATKYTRDAVTAIDGVEPVTSAPMLREFAVRLPVPAETVIERMADEGFLAGVALDDADYGGGVLIAATERRTRDEIDAYAQALQKVVR